MNKYDCEMVVNSQKWNERIKDCKKKRIKMMRQISIIETNCEEVRKD